MLISPRSRVGHLALIALSSLIAGSCAFAQVIEPSDPIPGQQTSTAAVEFDTAQQDLADQYFQLVDLGPSSTQLSLWLTQNGPSIDSLQVLAAQMGVISAIQPLTFSINSTSSSQINLGAAFTQIYNQGLATLPALGVTNAQLASVQEAAFANFQQQEGSAMSLLAEQPANASSAAGPPPPLVIPAEVTPQTATLLGANDQLVRSEVTFMNQFVNATPSAQGAALQQSLQQNAPLIQQLQTTALTSMVATPSTQIWEINL